METTEQTHQDDTLLTAKRKLYQRLKAGLPAPTQRVTKLKLSEVLEMPTVFQQRAVNQAASEKHVYELVKALDRNPKQALSPIVVYWVGDGWCCIDGHHRMEAYRIFEYKRPIPVTVFIGSLDDALLLSLSSNSKDKLPMSAQEKYNAAWRLVISTENSKALIAKAANVSERLVGKMRAVMNTISVQHPELSLDSLKWTDALRVEQGLAPKEFSDSRDFIEEEAKKLADRLSRTFGTRLSNHSEILYRALEIYDPRIPEWIADFYQPAEDDFDVPRSDAISEEVEF